MLKLRKQTQNLRPSSENSGRLYRQPALVYLLVSLLLGFSVALCSVHSYASSDACADLFKYQKPERNYLEYERRYEKRYLGGDLQNQLEFGLESELNMFENPMVVMWYRIPTYSESDWVKIDISKRIELGQAYNLKNKTSSKSVTAFEKLSNAPRVLPQILKFEGGGNFEINGIKFQSLGEAEDFVDLVTEYFGPTSWQGHVSFGNAPVAGAAGYSVFSSDRAMLSKLESAYQNISKGTVGTIPGKSFIHHSLGPMKDADRKLFISFEQDLANGEGFGEPGSAKTIGASVLRGKIYGPSRSGFELRPYHKNSLDLLGEMAQLTFDLEHENLSLYRRFSRVKQIDDYTLDAFVARNELGKIPDSLQEFLEAIEDTIRSKSNIKSFGGAKIRDRFLYPLRDWKSHPFIQDISTERRPEVERNLKQESLSYYGTLTRLAQSYKAEKQSEGFKLRHFFGQKPVSEVHLQELMLALANWAHSSGLPELFGSGIGRSTRISKESKEDSANLKAYLNVLVKEHQRQFTIDELKSSLPYEAFLDETVEIIYGPSTFEGGHIQLRIGQTMFSFNAPRNTTVLPLTNVIIKPTNMGAIAWVGRERIEELISDIKKIYDDSTRYNLPPMTTMGSQLNVDLEKKILTESTSKRISLFRGMLSRDKKYLMTPSGKLVPILRSYGTLKVQSYSCSTSAGMVLERFFNIQIPNLGARAVLQYMKTQPRDFLLFVNY